MKRVEGIEWGGRGAVSKLVFYTQSTITVILGRLEGVQWVEKFNRVDRVEWERVERVVGLKGLGGMEGS